MSTSKRIAVLGTGQVGQVIADALSARGHQVRMGARSADNPAAAAWAAAGDDRGHGDFATVSAWAEVVVNCTAGVHSVAALQAAGADNLAGKVLLDLANPLDFSKGFPPSLSVCNTDSLGEQLQRALPDTKVVKVLNTLSNPLMVDPAKVPGEHHLPISGNDPEAKEQVKAWLGEWFGWPASAFVDLGDISGARGQEAWLLLWVRLYGALQTPLFNLSLPRG